MLHSTSWSLHLLQDGELSSGPGEGYSTLSNENFLGERVSNLVVAQKIDLLKVLQDRPGIEFSFAGVYLSKWT